MESTMKKPKIQRRRCDGDASVNIDRITNLPEPIIHHIFSFLETLDVIRASAVTRKWRYLWIPMPYLDFNIFTVWLKLKLDSLNAVLEKFKDFVNWVLMSQEGTNIQRFRLTYVNFEDDHSVNRWINVAVQRNVQEIDLTIDSQNPIELPHCLVTCQSLMVLKLKFNQKILRLPSFVGFSRLKSLELESVELTDEVLARNFISGCTLLENLSMKGCIFSGFKVLDISAVNLKKLKIKNSRCFGSFDVGLLRSELKVSCPNLVAFNYRGPTPFDVSLQDTSSVQNAFVYLDGDRYMKQSSSEEWGSVMCKLLNGFCNTKALEVSSQFLHGEPAKPDCVSTSFHNLKSLRLFMGYEWQMQSVINLLKWSPNLEALTIHFESLAWQGGWSDDWKISDEAISCLTYHLKMVELINVEGTENALDLVRFLLKNGHVLEKMSVNWMRNLKNPGEIIQKVLKFHRSSSNVALKFLEPKSQINFFNL